MQLQVQQQKLLTGHKSGIYALHVIDDERFLSAAGDGWVAEWPFGKGKDGHLLSKVDAQIFAMSYHPQNDHIWLGDMNGGVYVISRSRKELLKKVKHHEKGTYLVRAYKDHVITAGSDGMFTVWSANELYPSDSFQLSNNRLRAIAFHPEEPIMAIGGGDGDIYIMDTGKWRWIQTIKGAHDDTIFDLVFLKDQNVLVSGSKDARIKVWDWRETKLLHNIPSHMFTINCLALNSNGKVLVSASRDKSFKFWNTDNWELLKVVDDSKQNYHMNSVNVVDWHPTKNVLITASDDRTIRLWNVQVKQTEND